MNTRTFFKSLAALAGAAWMKPLSLFAQEKKSRTLSPLRIFPFNDAFAVTSTDKKTRWVTFMFGNQLTRRVEFQYFEHDVVNNIWYWKPPNGRFGVEQEGYRKCRMFEMNYHTVYWSYD